MLRAKCHLWQIKRFAMAQQARSLLGSAVAALEGACTFLFTATCGTSRNELQRYFDTPLFFFFLDFLIRVSNNETLNEVTTAY